MALQGKVAIITGAGQGIGLAICKRLAASGARLILNDLDSGLATKAAEEISAARGVCLPVPGDAGRPETIQQMVDTAVANFGRLDIAVANAGLTLYGDFFSYSSADFFNVMKLNLGGTFFLAQAAAARMKEQEEGGSLLFMSSVTGHRAHKNLAAYGMSKAAIEMLAKTLVVELSPFGINVNCVAPGATATERTLQDANYKETWSRITPLGRPAAADDIAATASFLVSEEARHITGQTIVVDGGWTCVSPSPY